MSTSAIPAAPDVPALATTVGGRTAAELVDAAMQLARRHYTVLVTATAVAFAPLFLLSPFLVSRPQLLLRILAGLSGGWAEASLLLALTAAYRGEAMGDVWTVVKAGRASWWRVARLKYTRSVMTMLAALLLVVPGFFAYAYYLLATPAAAIEGLKVRAAIERGARLAKGEYRRIILAGGLGMVLYVLLLVAVNVFVSALSGSELVGFLVQMSVEVALMPVLVAITVLLYHDIRERREGLDLELAIARA